MKKYQEFINDKIFESAQYFLNNDKKLNLIFSVKNNALSNVRYYIKNRNKLHLLSPGGVNIDLNTKDEWGKTALIYASYWRFSTKMIKMIDELIVAGADWNIKDNDGKDFIDRLNDDKRFEIVNDIIKKYPEKYNTYLINKKANKYNIL